MSLSQKIESSKQEMKALEKFINESESIQFILAAVAQAGADYFQQIIFRTDLNEIRVFAEEKIKLLLKKQEQEYDFNPYPEHKGLSDNN